MVSVKPQFNWKTVFLPAVGIAAFIAYLYLFQVDIPEIINAVQSTDMRIYLLAAFLIFIDTFLYAMAWRYLLSFLSVKLSVVKAYLYVWYGTFMDIIIPAESVSGEISRIYLVTRDYGNDISGKVVASLITHRLISMGVGVATLLAGMSMLIAETQVNSLVFNLTLFLIAATLFFLALIILLCVKGKWTLKIIDWIIRLVGRLSGEKWKPTKIREEAVKLAGMFHHSMSEYRRSPGVVAFSVSLSSLSWISYILISYLVFLAIGYPQVPWSVILTTQGIVTAVKSIPMGVPFEIGLPEITMTTLYGVLGIPWGISATSTILSRILTLWVRFFIGFAVQQWFEIRSLKGNTKHN